MGKGSVVEVSDVRVYVLQKKAGSSLRAFASITLGDAFAVTGVRVIEGKKGLFVAMPSRNAGTEKEPDWQDTAFPVTKQMREAVNEAVMAAYADAEHAPKKAQAKGKGRK